MINCWLDNGVIDESQLQLDLNSKACSTIEVLKTNCIDFEECPKIKDELTDLNILVNPLIDESLSFSFISTLPQNITYAVYNLNNQQLISGGLTTEKGLNTKTIQLPYTKGFYFLSILDGNTQLSTKFLKL